MSAIQRKFIPGQQWLYFKIYSGPRFLEELLITDILPLVTSFYHDKQIDRFFFVRYQDDGYHIRVRFRITSPGHLGTILTRMEQVLANHVKHRLISKVLLDTYDRELERYGASSMAAVEAIFSYGSLHMLHHFASPQEEFVTVTNRWLYGIKSMDNLLSQFGFNDPQKHELYETYFQAYAKEFQVQKSVKEQLKVKYRNNSRAIEAVMKKELSPFGETDMLKEAITDILSLHQSGALEIKLNALLHSIMHMHFNRIFATRSRLNEFVIYYFMSNFYKSRHIRETKVVMAAAL